MMSVKEFAGAFAVALCGGVTGLCAGSSLYPLRGILGFLGNLLEQEFA